MCEIHDKKWRIAEKDMVVYKVVRENGKSEVPPELRAVLPRYKSRVEMLRYTTGTVVVSPSGPGIMAYKTKKVAEHRRSLLAKIARLTIKKGTKYRTGKHSGYDIITAQKVYVGKVYEYGIGCWGR